MRKFLSIFLALAMTLSLLPTFAMAVESEVEPSGNVAAVYEVGSDTEIRSYATLQGAVNAAEDNQIVRLLKDVMLTNQLAIGSAGDEKRILTLDLNGHNISRDNRVMMVQNADLTVTGQGKIYETAPYYGAITIKGSNDETAENYTVVTVGPDVELAAWSAIFVTPYASSGAPYAYGVAVNVNGAKLTGKNDTDGNGGCAIYVNGQISHAVNAPKFVLNNVTQISEGGAGMYLAGYADTTITGGSITGPQTAIEIRAGRLTINGGTYTATNSDYQYTPNGNGATTVGAALAIMQHTTKKDIDVTIKNGTFIGAAAVAEKNVQQNDPDPRVTMSIENGTFSGQIDVDDATAFISGGTFTADPSAYLAGGATALHPVDGKYLVATGVTHTAAKAATCTEAGNKEYWTAGGNKYTRNEGGVYTLAGDVTLAKLPHSLTKTDAKAATYTENGNNEYYTCSVCHKVFKDAGGQTETTVEDETLAKLTPSSDSGSSSGSTTTKTETTTNPDGSTTKTETKADGTTVETTTGKDGTTTKTESKTETKSDGSKVETKTETVTAKDGSKTESKTETTTAADGSKTETKSETKTAADGTKTETESKTETKADGTTTGTETKKTTDVNGSTGTTTTTTKNGNTKTEAEAKISEKAAEEAKKNDAPVTAPVEVKAGESPDSAPTVKIELPENAGKTKVEIPVSNVNSGTVAVIVNEDGTEEIVKNAIVTENGVVLGVEGNTTVKIIDNSKDFIDTRNHWSRDEVNFVAARELFNGVGNNLFGVSGDMTRGMVNTVLARLAGEDTNSGANWYDKGTEWAKKNGITDGTNPTANVTREQLAAMLYRFAGSPAVSGELSFADADQISGYAKDALLWAVQNGILNGTGNNLVAPKNSAERAQVAAMMARYLKNVG